MLALIHGFTPFGEHDLNPSEQLMASVGRTVRRTGHAKGSARVEVVTEVLPVSGQGVSEQVPKLIAEHRPDIWVGVGLAEGRPSLSIEAVAVNLAGWDEPDNDGELLERSPVVREGPAAYLTTLPVEQILEGWRLAGIPGYLSQTAGSFCCNQSFYLAAHTVSELGLPSVVGFIHLPLLPEQVVRPALQPSMAMELQAAGLATVINTSRMSTDDSGPYLRRTL